MLGEREQVATVVDNSTFAYQNLHNTLALGVLVLAKHDRAASTHGPAYCNTQLAGLDAFTVTEIDRCREPAGIMLNQFLRQPGHTSAAAAQPGRLVGRGLAGDGRLGGYALSLILLAGVFRVFGSDIITAIEWWTGKPG